MLFRTQKITEDPAFALIRVLLECSRRKVAVATANYYQLIDIVLGGELTDLGVIPR